MAYSVARPKTIFELLGLPSDATRAEVVTAYQALCKHYESGAHGLSASLADYKLASLRSAMEAYSSRDVASETGSSRSPTIMVAAPPVIWSEIEGESPLWARRRKKFAIMTSWTSTGLKFLLGLIGLMFLFKMMFSFAPNQAMNTNQVNDTNAAEKIIIQEYYMETGYLASSISEVESRRAQEKIEADERRISLQAQREQETQQREYERFVEESRRIGESVSQRLQHEEAQQRYQEERQREQEELRQQYIEQEQARMEQERINAERRRLGMAPVY
ncbi:MAG: hypothetical protein KKF58_04415 [Gammaproteobacteria bacterium]|nr:hypothetical protein [Gammaproteobacteria bacterium]MBU1447535.1 hypothetical protein [Gammaproteobacteria bacterium]